MTEVSIGVHRYCSSFGSVTYTPHVICENEDIKNKIEKQFIDHGVTLAAIGMRKFDTEAFLDMPKKFEGIEYIGEIETHYDGQGCGGIYKCRTLKINF